MNPSLTYLPPPAQPHTPTPTSTAPSPMSSIPTSWGVFKDLGLGVSGSQLALMGLRVLLGLCSHWQPHTWG